MTRKKWWYIIFMATCLKLYCFQVGKKKMPVKVQHLSIKQGCSVWVWTTFEGNVFYCSCYCCISSIISTWVQILTAVDWWKAVMGIFCLGKKKSSWAWTIHYHCVFAFKLISKQWAHGVSLTTSTPTQNQK